jgi:signal transduction histidine kinase
LPPAQVLSNKNFLNGGLDATLVCIQSRLVGFGADHSDQVLELQAGTRNYFAKLNKHRGQLNDLLPGSLLNVTGVYAGQGGDRRAGGDIDSFELLLNSPAEVQVLVRPSWWTFRHTLTVISVMAFVIVAALVWITLLRRQVEERSVQLTSEIKGRAEAESRHALEEERARIAQDLHDELGATLTEIRFIGAVNSRDSSVPPSAQREFMGVSEKSLQMVSLLDEIVWAVNPANDSVPSLASYLPHMAEEFFGTTQVRCRVDVGQTFPPVALSSEARHNLCLTVMETMNNIAKHSQATEVWLRIHWNDSGLHIAVEDNGCGFASHHGSRSGNGLVNMRRRLEKIGGRFECDSRPGLGTVCRMDLPLASENYANQRRHC